MLLIERCTFFYWTKGNLQHLQKLYQEITYKHLQTQSLRIDEDEG